MKVLPTVNKLYRRKVVEPLAHGIGNLSEKKPFKSMVNFLEKSKITPTLMLQLLSSLSLTVFTLHSISESKKIEEDRKPFLAIDTVLTTAITFALSIVVDKKTEKLLKHFDIAYLKDPNMCKEQLSLKRQSIESMKSHTIYATIVRLMVPVLLVPVVGKLVSEFSKYKEKRAKEALGERPMQNNAKFNSKNWQF